MSPAAPARRASEPAPPGRLAVATSIFEGPMELLLSLADREEVDILQVSLASLTEAYLAELAALEQRDPDEMAEFLWLAARLLLLKSIRLLPGQIDEEEEAELVNWEEDVRTRLLEYAAYKAMAEGLMLRSVDVPTYAPPSRPAQEPDQETPIQVDALMAAFQGFLASLPPRPLVYVGTGWTVGDKLEGLRERLKAGAFDLGEVILACADRAEAVVTFLAVLELLRTNEAAVSQAANFGKVVVEPRTPAAAL